MSSENDYPDSALLEELLAESAQRHRHLCPRQVLGVRLGLCGLRALGLVGDHSLPRYQNLRKRLLVIAETDGCGLDGLAVATDTAVGRRTLRVVDYGKVAATLVDVRTERAVRVAPANNSRQLACRAAPTARSRWHAYLEGYRQLPDQALVVVAAVELRQSVAQILSRAGARTNCDQCGEEIMNEREIVCGKQVLCRSCAGDSYYRSR